MVSFRSVELHNSVTSPAAESQTALRNVIFAILISVSVTSHLPSYFQSPRPQDFHLRFFRLLRSRPAAFFWSLCTKNHSLKHSRTLPADDFAAAKRAKTCNGNHGNSPVSQQCMSPSGVHGVHTEWASLTQTPNKITTSPPNKSTVSSMMSDINHLHSNVSVSKRPVFGRQTLIWIRQYRADGYQTWIY